MRPPAVATPDSELNMTPMIDIVFQLILFFLFNLRFKTIDHRIETALPRDGCDPTPPIVDPPLRIPARLVRLDAEDPARARTEVRLGGQRFAVPPVTASRAERDAAFARVAGAIRDLVATGAVRGGEVDTPLPNGGLVPHADVVGLVDAFLLADVGDITFVGAPMPRPR